MPNANSPSSRHARAKIVQHLDHVAMLTTSINGWANEYAAKLPRPAKQTMDQYRLLLSSEVEGLRHSLAEYDRSLARALDKDK